MCVFALFFSLLPLFRAKDDNESIDDSRSSSCLYSGKEFVNPEKVFCCNNVKVNPLAPRLLVHPIYELKIVVDGT